MHPPHPELDIWNFFNEFIYHIGDRELDVMRYSSSVAVKFFMVRLPPHEQMLWCQSNPEILLKNIICVLTNFHSERSHQTP